MNKSDNYSSSPSSDDSRELLRELMPKLGMEAAEPGQKYKTRAMLRYFLPRLAAVCVAVALLAALGIYLFTPSSIQQVSVQEVAGKLTVDLKLSRVLLLESVTAKLDGRPVVATMVEPGHYQIEPDANGVLDITVRTVTGRETAESLTISSIDDEPPHVVSDTAEGDDIVICFSDGDGSGIDWTTLQATDVRTGGDYAVELVDEAQGRIRLPFPDQALRISLSDNSGNHVSVLLEVHPAQASQPDQAPESPAPIGSDEPVEIAP